MTNIATMPVAIYAFDGETTVQTTLFQLQQWKHALRLEEKGLKMSGGRQVSTHLRQLLGTPARYPRKDLLAHIEASIESIEEQLGVTREGD